MKILRWLIAALTVVVWFLTPFLISIPRYVFGQPLGSKQGLSFFVHLGLSWVLWVCSQIPPYLVLARKLLNRNDLNIASFAGPYIAVTALYNTLWWGYLWPGDDELTIAWVGMVMGHALFVYIDEKLSNFGKHLTRRGQRRWLAFKAALGNSLQIFMWGINISSILVVAGSYAIIFQIEKNKEWPGIFWGLVGGLSFFAAFTSYIFVPILTVSGMFGVLMTFYEKRSKLFKDFYREECMQPKFLLKVNVFTVYFYWIWYYLYRVGKGIFSGLLFKTLKEHYVLSNWVSGTPVRKRKKPPSAWYEKLLMYIELAFWTVILPVLYVVLLPLIENKEKEELQ